MLVLQSGAPATVSLVITATEVGGTGLTATSPVSIVVNAVPTPPTIQSNQVLSVDEFHCFPGEIIGGLSATSLYFAISNYTISGNPLRPVKPGPGNPALNIDPTSGQVTMAIALSYGPDVQPYIWNGYQVKDVMLVRKGCEVPLCVTSANLARVSDQANATVCDVSGLCGTGSFTVIVTPNVTAGLAPVITGINYAVGLDSVKFAFLSRTANEPPFPSVQPSSTSGNTSVTFIGQNFVFGSAVLANYSNRDGVLYTASQCAVQTGSAAIVCYTVPGYGASLSWTVSMGGVLVQTTLISGLLTSYVAPMLTSVSQAPVGIYQFPTAGLAQVTITGTGFGPAGTPVAVSYAYPSLSPFALKNAVVTVDDTVVEGLMGPGCGANLPVTVSLGLGATGVLPAGENVASSSSAPNSTMIYYSPPLNNWSIAAAPHVRKLRVGTTFLRHPPTCNRAPSRSVDCLADDQPAHSW